jgi:hypothetical protein
MKMSFSLIISLACFLSSLTGCHTNVDVDTPSSPVVIHAVGLKAGLMLDKSGSANSTRTTQPTIADLQPLIDRIRRTGGELAVGIISDDSNRPLIRLRIEPPPAMPVEPIELGDADQSAAAYDKYQQDQEAYVKEKKTWDEETEARINRFKTNVAPILNRKPNAKHSDVINAVNRVDLAFSEKDPTFPPAGRKVIILNSDCQDNVKAKLNKLTSGVRLVVVNGVGSVGSLKDLNPELFESLTSAINEIVKGEQ